MENESTSLKGQARSQQGKKKKEKTEQQALWDFVWMTPMSSAVPENELWSQWENLTVPTTHMALVSLFLSNQLLPFASGSL